VSTTTTSASTPPQTLRIGHLVYTVVVDDGLLTEHGTRSQCTIAGFSHSALQSIVLGTKSVTSGNRPFGEDYRREVLLHEVLHSCLRVTGCDPDRDAKADCTDVEERAVEAISGPLLAALRDNPELVTYLLNVDVEERQA
jgi:hypothetical protein